MGRALAHLPGEIDPRAVVVAELSSFQLEHIERFRPDVAVLLNLTEDHIDRHGSYAGYVDAKLRIFENQTPDDLALVNVDDPGTSAAMAAGLPGRGRRGGFSRSVPASARGRDGKAVALLAGVTAGALWLQTAGRREELCAVADLALKGEHNVANSLAAAAAAAAIGVVARATSPRPCARSRASPIASRWSAWSTA